MFKLLKTRVKRVFAGVMAALLIVNCLPMNAQVYAATVNSFTVCLKDGENTAELDGVSITLTDTTDESNTMTSTTVQGVATFTDFVDSDITYKMSVSDITGYEKVADSQLTIATDQTTVDISVTALEEITISGTVVDEQNNAYVEATVEYTGYGNGSVITNEKGEYSFKAYKGKEYTIVARAKEDKYTQPSVTVTSSEASYVCSPLAFAVKTFTITTSGAEDESKGTITQTATVDYGTDFTVEATAKQGYQIQKIVLNGTDIIQDAGTKNWSQKLENIQSNQAVQVVFTEIKYTLSYNIGANGEMTYVGESGSTEVPGGTVASVEINESTDENSVSKLQVTATPDTGYRVSKVIIDGGEPIEFAENDRTYTCVFDMNEDHSFAVEFSLNGYNIKVPETENGTVVSNKTLVETGGEVSVTFTPSNNYKVDKIFVKTTSNTTGTEVNKITDVNYVENLDNSSTYTYKNVTEETTFEVTFSEIQTSTKEWTEDVDIAGTIIGGTSYEDGNGNIVYAFNKDSQATITSKYNTDEGYANQLRVRYYGKDNFEPWTESQTIDSSCVISEIQVREAKLDNVVNVNLNGKNIIIVIDKTAPVVSEAVSVTWTNTEPVSITGKVTDENTQDNPSSGISHLVWSKDTALDEAGILAGTNTVTPESDGSFKIENISGEQDATYYIYVVDKAGNISQEKTAKIQIDKTAPEITGFTFSTKSDEVKQDTINFSDSGIYCMETLYVTVNASDSASGVDNKNIALYTGETQISPIQEGSNIFALTEADFKDGKSIYAKVIDNAGNISVETKPTDKGITSDVVVIASTSEDFKVSIINPSQGIYVKKDEKTGTETLYAKDSNLAFSVAVSDTKVGIKSVVIKVNGQEQVNEVKPTETSFDVNTSDKPVQDGKASVEVVTENNLGLKSTEKVEVCIDNTAPEITDFKFEKIDSTGLAKILEYLTFGMYSNDKVKITVTASDAGAGVKTITLYGKDNADGIEEVIGTEEVNEQNQCEFIIPLKDITDGTKHFDKIISAKATDNVGNETASFIEPTTVNSNIKNSGLMIETIKPVVSVTYTNPVSDTNELTDNDRNCYTKETDVEFEVVVQDIDSGLKSVDIKINDTIIVNKSYTEKITGAMYFDNQNSQLSTANPNVAINEDDGSYKLIVEVTDNAGNVTKSETVVYKDGDAPILSFAFSHPQYVEGDTQNLKPETTEYGFYFKEDTNVTIFAKDSITGAKNITYYTVNQNGETSVQTKEFVDENSSVTFTIPANFKGQIFALAEDNVGNIGAEFVTPNSAIIEDKELHNSEEHIAFMKTDAPYKTSNNTDLYTASVPITLVVTDTYSGIREIEWSVVAPYDTTTNQKGKVTINNDSTVVEGSDSGWQTTQREYNLVTEMKRDIVVDSNSNDIEVNVKMTDRAGNITEEKIVLSIDKIAPTVSIELGSGVMDETHDNYFRSERSATITIKENNFTPDKVSCSIRNSNGIAPSVGVWQQYGTGNDTYYTTTVNFTGDGHYSISVGCSDLAGHSGNTVTTEEFTIDMTKPEVVVTYDNNSAQNDNYYDAERTATIVVTEHNFDPSRVAIIGTAIDNGTEIAFPVVGDWFDNGDTHSASIYYSQDAHYTFDVEITDKSGNTMNDFEAEEFVVDKTAPTIEFSGVADLSANNGDVVPVITYTDTNFNRDNVSVVLSGINNGQVSYPGYPTDIINGQNYVFSNFSKEQSVDDIYTLSVTVVDMAGNETQSSIVFSVNRFGSVYDLRELKDLNGSYTNRVGDLVFTETNVDTLDRETISIKLTKNGIPTDLKEGTDYTITVAGGEGQWSRYTYTLTKDLFVDDGKYSIAIYSKDAAGNINENIDEDKTAEITFGVDNTAPVVVPIDLEEGQQYAVEVKTVVIEIKDNLILDSVKIYLNEQEVSYTVEGESYIFDILESTDRQSVRIVAADAAGNRYDLRVKDILVTTSVFARFYNNTPLFVGTIIVIAIIAIGGAGIVLFGGKKGKKKM